MSNNPIFDNNMACIYRYNPKLVEDLISITSAPKHISIDETKLAEPTLSYNGTSLHSIEGAEIESKNIFNQISNSFSSIHVIFGIGLGYLFKEFCQNSKGIVILYEPNLEILRITLDVVDFREELSQKNVRIVSDIDSFKRIFVECYTYNANTTFSFLNSYKQLFPENFNNALNQVELIAGGCLAEFNTVKDKVAFSIFMTLSNLNLTLKETPLLEFDNAYKGKTAVIVSAGPSLDLNIETLKKNREKVVIFCVGTAAKALFKNDITPDFLNIIEVNDCSSQVKDLDLSQVNLVLEPYTNNYFHRVKTKNKISFPSNSSHANICWSKLTGVDITPYKAKGTVSYEALCCAKVLGFKKIILIGQDLAFANNQCYSKDSAYSNLICEFNEKTNKYEMKIKNYDEYLKSIIPDNPNYQEEDGRKFVDYKIKNLNDTLYFVKDVNGKTIPTQGNYATFLEHFREFAAENKDLELINTSSIGANIDGFKNISLEEALKKVEVIKDKIEIGKSDFSYDKRKILQNIDREVENLKSILNKFEIAKEYMFKYERDFSRNKTLTKESNRYFKFLLELYTKINAANNFPGPLFKGLAFYQEVELEYLIKNSETATVDNIQEVYAKLKQYYEIVSVNISHAIEEMNRQKGELIESINSES